MLKNLLNYPKSARKSIDIILINAQKVIEAIMKVHKNLYILLSKVRKNLWRFHKSAQQSMDIINKSAQKSFQTILKVHKNL